MSKLPDKFDAKNVEIKWRKYWLEQKIYKWQNDKEKEQTFVIDTPPPTVSGLLHMGHVFSYTQADFVARYNRMIGKDVFYPMGFDDNGLPTERLVEKIIGTKAMIYESKKIEENGGVANKNGGYFVEKCREVVDEAEKEFEALFNEIALSVDWEQKYQTISPESQKISQASFIDLYKKGLVEKRYSPVFWDISDRTALAQADIVDKDVDGEMHYINFAIDGEGDNLQIMTTRPELLPACVAVMINGEDERYRNLILNKLNQDGEGESGSYAITPIFGVKVPIVVDNSVQLDKGTGVVMCCTFGDETDLKWWRKHNFPNREIIGHDGLIKKLINVLEDLTCKNSHHSFQDYAIMDEKNASFLIEKKSILDSKLFLETYQKISGQKIKDAKKIIIDLLNNSSPENINNQGGGCYSESLLTATPNSNHSILTKSEKISRPVKCAERSGVPIEIISQPQWFIKILPFKEKLKQKAQECNWYPEYMRVRIEQWIDGLSWDWCISRQRFFGVKIPAWSLTNVNPENHIQPNWGNYNFNPKLSNHIILPNIQNLPIDPTVNIPDGYIELKKEEKENLILEYQNKGISFQESDKNKKIIKDQNNEFWFLDPETDVLDTWATSSISPQLSSKGISDEIYFDRERHAKLFPADLRPQAHEIIRTWAFYTIVKSLLHEDKIPWKNLMISGWCLASDKTKMSKSKGNVITPQALIQEKSADVVRYWASASNLGADIAYSEDVFKIGQKLITKIFNASKFCSQHFEMLVADLGENFNDKILQENIYEVSDLWILSKLNKVIKTYHQQFQNFEYARAREVVEEFFWKDFCDNYLEICKVRSYGLDAEKLADIELNLHQKQEVIDKQVSALATLYLTLKALLKLFAPFIPHITEEIYSTIFDKEFHHFKSIHARGNKVDNYEELSTKTKDKKAQEIGEEMIKIIFEVRKFKSENNLSMKTTITNLQIASNLDLTNVVEDLSNVCNAHKIEFLTSPNFNVKIIS